MEFQYRGSQHDHGLIWNAEAPTYFKSPEQQMVKFVDRDITILDLPRVKRVQIWFPHSTHENNTNSYALSA